MSWRDVAQAAGISEAALRTIRRGVHAPTELTAAHIDDALQWLPGSVRATLAGGDPRSGEATVEPQEIREALQAATELTDPEEMRAALLDLLSRISSEEDQG